ncbi:MAG: aldehyde dehydrogenase family protein, partial [Candidatus Thorarchaeota archaeon]
MRFFGHLIKGEKSKPIQGKTSYFPNMNIAIGEPRLLYAMALKDQGSLSKLAARYISGLLPEKVPEIRLLKDFIKVHGFPHATNDEIQEMMFAEYAVGGVKETAVACDEAHSIRHLMHKEYHENSKALTLKERAESLVKVGEILWKHFDDFKEIGIAEGTPVKLFEWQTKGVFNTLYKEHIDFATSRLTSREIPSSKEGEKTFLSRYPFGAVGIFPPYNAAIGLGGMAIICSYWAGNATVTRTPSK